MSTSFPSFSAAPEQYQNMQAPMAQPPAPFEAGSLPAVVMELAEALQKHRTLLENLEQRLGPVLRHIPMANRPDEPKAVRDCELAQGLGGAVDQLAEMSVGLHGILHRLAL